jgi:hypothetical protein
VLLLLLLLVLFSKLMGVVQLLHDACKKRLACAGSERRNEP